MIWGWEALGLPDPPEVEHGEGVPEFGLVGWVAASAAVVVWSAIAVGVRRVCRLWR